MSYQILASVCQHPIRASSSLPYSGSNLDFDVRYCPSCSASRSVRQERDTTEQRYRQDRDLQELFPESDRTTARESRREYDRSRLAYQEDLDYQQDRQDRERRAAGRPTMREEGRQFAGLDDPEYLDFRRQMNGYGRTTRIAEPEPERHRSESQYRDQREYLRTSRRYEPGRYADRSGSGYYDTSDPYRRR
ncbi:hypothetical protein LTR36_008178 [Oleoguttula mirabilis]|uniref:Uncharacterized protein n=1 Tax=Oleoguttula mirabilis TaxID=1507867 RepID=A0AAV9J976_9PEZI|nr:hypothetical protein LTR36_008178 [Oleoguttula mirabilis]